MAAYINRVTVVPSVGSQIHIGAYISHTTLFMQLRQRSSQSMRNDDLDVRWVSGGCGLVVANHAHLEFR